MAVTCLVGSVAVAACGSGHVAAGRPVPVGQAMRAGTWSSAVGAQAAALVTAIDRHHLGRDVQGWGVYSPCAPAARLMSYGQSVSFQSLTGMSAQRLNRLLVATLRQAGWKVTVLDVARISQPFPVRHPIDHLSRNRVSGAINVQASKGAGPQALIFLNSACFNAGSHAAALQRSAVRFRYATRKAGT